MLEKSLRLIGYVGHGNGLSSAAEQIAAIKQFCRVHKHKLVAIFTDSDHPSFGLTQAITAMKNADGMITYNLRNLTKQCGEDWSCELRPLIDAEFMHKHKKLLTVADGIETVTPIGQENLITLLNEWSRREEMPVPTMDQDEHSRYTTY